MTSVIHLVFLFTLLATGVATANVEKCSTVPYPPVNASSIQWYTVNLDDEPLVRWNSVIKDKQHEIRRLIEILKEYISSQGLSFLIEFMDNVKFWTWFLNQLPMEYRQEMIGIANFMKIPIGEVAVYNIFYEFSTACTSIVAEDASGQLFHARNLDFGAHFGIDNKTMKPKLTEAMRPALVNVKFMRKGKLVFKSVHFAGFIGILTGVKPDMFTLTINTRENPSDLLKGLLSWITGDRTEKWIPVITRDIFEYETDFDRVKFILSNQTLVSSIYFTLGGRKSGEGCVISRSRTEAVNTWNIGDKEGDGWFVLETNSDGWKNSSQNDPRRVTGMTCMHQLNRKALMFKSLFDVLSTRPVLNIHTTYTALMQVNTADIFTYIQDCAPPCQPRNPK